MTDAATRLDDPLEVEGKHGLPSRVVKAAMSEGLADDEGLPSEAHLRLYERWAGSGAGALITGNVMVDGRHLGEPGNVFLDDAQPLAPFARWAEAMTPDGDEGPLRIMQLNHPGRQAPRFLDPEPLAPSEVQLKRAGAFAPPRAMTQVDIDEVIARFATAAGRAVEAGFHGVQLHAAHGYLLSQFLSPLVNQRSDEYGGSLENRARFLLEIVDAVRAAIGLEAHLWVKLNAADFQRGGFSAEDALRVAQWLDERGVDVLEVSGGSYERPAMAGISDEVDARAEAQRGYFHAYASAIREKVATPILLTGGLRTAAGMTEVLSSGAADLIGLARPMAFEPHLPRALIAGDDAAPGVRKVGIATVDALLATGWYQAQLMRMGRGQPPAPRLSRWRVLFEQLWRMLRGKRVRRGTRAG